jgi:hypothetical protein
MPATTSALRTVLEPFDTKETILTNLDFRQKISLLAQVKCYDFILLGEF